MDVIKKIAIGTKILAERGGVSPSNSYHYVRLQITVFFIYFLSPVLFYGLFYFDVPDDVFIYSCIIMALVLDYISGKLIKNIDLHKSYPYKEFKDSVLLVNVLYIFAILLTVLFILFIAS